MSRNARAFALLVVVGITFLAALQWQHAAPLQNSTPAVPPPAGPTFWKGNLHTHSLWSDGDDFPEMIADWYKTHGYHFLCLSDHNVLSEGQRWTDLKPGPRVLALEKYRARFGDFWVEQRKGVDKDMKPVDQVRLKPLSEFRSLLDEPGKFLLVQGEEVTHKFAKNPVHINAINVRNPILPLDGSSVRETIAVNLRQIQEQRTKTGYRILAFLNHPNWQWGVNVEDMLADELKYFEVFNGHPGVKNYGDDTHPNTERMWDIALALRLSNRKLPIVYGLATDDAHNYHVYGAGKPNPGRGWIMVRAHHLTSESLVDAMERGDFYASSGVSLADVRRDGKKIIVQVKPEEGVKYRIEFIAAERDAPLDSKAAQDEKGNLLPVSRIYSPMIGTVAQSSEGTSAEYTFTGKEIYVRARVISSKLHPNPFQKGDVEMAWTQPVTP